MTEYNYYTCIICGMAIPIGQWHDCIPIAGSTNPQPYVDPTDSGKLDRIIELLEAILEELGAKQGKRGDSVGAKND